MVIMVRFNLNNVTSFRLKELYWLSLSIFSVNHYLSFSVF